MHPILANLSSDVWAMEPAALEKFLAAVASIDPKLRASLDMEMGPTGRGYVANGKTARIPVKGVLLQSGAAEYRAWGIEATGYDEIEAGLAAANADPAIARIELSVDSPGGHVSGIHSASDAVYGSEKPVTAHVLTLAASAAYWLSSQTGNISANRGAEIGSIGAYVAVADLSRAAESAGVKIHVVSSGEHKGTGVPGTVITETQLAEMQSHIDRIAGEFVADVARGRRMDANAVKSSASGLVYSGQDAISRGLIDRISADPEKERKMADSLKMVASLIKELPAHAEMVATLAAEGKAEDFIRAAVSDIVNKAHLAKLENDAKASAEAAAKAQADAVAKDAEIAALKASLADVSAKHEALAALKAGTVPASKVEADPEKTENTKSAAELAAMSSIDQAKFYASGGQIKA